MQRVVLILLLAWLPSACAGHYGPSDYPYSVERPSTLVFAYPERGQSDAKARRDRYECYLWAKRKTGFDPSAPELAPHQRVSVETRRRESTVLPGALFGALTGALVGAPEHAAEAAAIGAIVGGTAGAIRDAAEDDARRHAAARRVERRQVQVELRAERYRRALAACLEGRGYATE